MRVVESSLTPLRRYSLRCLSRRLRASALHIATGDAEKRAHSKRS